MIVVEMAGLALLCLTLGSIVWSTLRLGISPMPTSGKVKREVLVLLSKELEGEVHELGAGWGTLAWAAAARCPRARVIAWEASLVPYLFCRLRRLVQPRPNLSLCFGDFYRADLSRAKVVICYLWTGAMTRLGPKFDSELSKGATVISHTFAWRGRSAEQTRITADLYRTPVYRYRL